jgi:hypothetical protein
VEVASRPALCHRERLAKITCETRDNTTAPTIERLALKERLSDLPVQEHQLTIDSQGDPSLSSQNARLQLIKEQSIAFVL